MRVGQAIRHRQAGVAVRVRAVHRLQRDTRHFAKRQMTWFRGDPNVHWLTLDEEESGEHVAHRVLEYLEYQGIPGASRVA